jgi:hypothetical protein
MSRGSNAGALSRHRVVAICLIGIIVVCAVLLGVRNLSKPWTVALQVLTAVVGAALGNYLRRDLAESVVRNQARPATRHLFDQVGRLRQLVQLAETHELNIREAWEQGRRVDPDRSSDWFGSLGRALRDEINATATAIENWGDLAPDVQDSELANYESRGQRLPQPVESFGRHNG